MTELPAKWKLIKLSDLVSNPKDDIVDGPFGSNLKASEYVDSGVPLIRLQNIERNKFINKNIRYITKEKSQELQRHNFMKGDIVITKLGNPLGKACIVPENFPNGIVVADVVRARVDEGIVNKNYLLYAINSQQVIEQLEPFIKGTTRPRVNLTHLRNIKVPYAPLDEQKLIVEKIEELFSQLDAGVAGLKRAQAELQGYRASVLKAAFEGRLVPQDPNDEPAWQLLQKMGKQPRSNLNANPLPEGWAWSSFDDIVKKMSNGTTMKQSKEKIGLPVTRIETISNGYVDLERVRYLKNPSEKLIEKYKMDEGDILFSHINSDAHLGKTALFNLHNKMVLHGMNLLRLQVSKQIINPKFTHYLCQYYRISGKFIDIAQHAVNQSSINQATLKQVEVPLPPANEQIRIINKIDEYLSVVEEIEFLISKSSEMATGLRQSILWKVFSGRLV